MTTPSFPYKTVAPHNETVPERPAHPHRSLWELSGLSLKELAAKVGKNVLEDDLTGRAAQLAYYFFLSLFPTLIFISSLTGLILGSQSGLRDQLLQSFATFLPPTAYALVVTTFNEILKASSAQTALLGILFAFWSATSGMTATQDTLNAVCKMKETRPIWKTYLIAMALTVVVLALALSALAIFFDGGRLVGFVAHHIGLSAGLTFLWRAVQWPLALFQLSLAFSFTYYWAPDLKHKTWRWITPGSVIGILGWLAVSGAFRLYLHFFNHYSLTYGSLGAVIILLLWFYLSGFMLLLGGEVNATIWYMNEEADRHRHERHRLAGHHIRRAHHSGEGDAPTQSTDTPGAEIPRAETKTGT